MSPDRETVGRSKSPFLRKILVARLKGDLRLETPALWAPTMHLRLFSPRTGRRDAQERSAFLRRASGIAGYRRFLRARTSPQHHRGTIIEELSKINKSTRRMPEDEMLALGAQTWKSLRPFTRDGRCVTSQALYSLLTPSNS